MNQGWIKFHRQFRNWQWRDDPKMVSLFINLLIEVNHETSKYRGLDVPAGSGVFGREKLSQITGLSVQQVRTCLNKLKSTSEITIKSTNKFSIISITNWKTYQTNNHQPNQQLTINQPTDNQQVTTSKEGKKVRREEKKETRAGGVEFDEVFWPEYPNKVGKPKAASAFATARRAASLNEIMDGLRRYIGSKPADRSWLNPATFLNQARWSDEPAPVAQSRAPPPNPMADALASTRRKLGISDEPDDKIGRAHV